MATDKQDSSAFYIGGILLVCPLKPGNYAIIPLTTLMMFDTMELFCRICGHYHVYTEDGGVTTRSEPV